MSQIYNYIPHEKILSVHDYNGPNNIIKFNYVKFRTDKLSEHNFYTPIGIIDDKIISTTNKQLSFLPARLNHFLGDAYGRAIQHTYTSLLNNSSCILIEEPVFHFFDYESISGTGHSYDLMFYLLYIYKKANSTSKLLVVNSDNTYYNSSLSLIKKYYNVDYIYIDLGQNYLFKDFSCVQTYQNILFHEVKAFINETLIKPIINKYEFNNVPFFKNAYKLKVSNISNINRLNCTHDISDSVVKYFKDNSFINLDTVDEEYRIYLLNKADNIIISWGSIFYINIDYYITETINKNITIIFHPNMLPELSFLNVQGTEIIQNMPSWATSEYYRDQVYTTLQFKGKILCMDTITHL